MARTMRLTAILSLAGTLLLSALYRATSGGIWLSLAITCGTVAYHIIMRLLVGLAFNTGMQNRANYTSRWYQVSRREMAVYEKLKVKRWKRGMPTYDPSLFDHRTRTWEEIVQATCQAELVHETIAVLSFLPIAACGSEPIRCSSSPPFWRRRATWRLSLCSDTTGRGL